MRNDCAASLELDEYPNVTLQQLLNFPRFSIKTLVHFILLLLLLLLLAAPERKNKKMKKTSGGNPSKRDRTLISQRKNQIRGVIFFGM